MTEIKAERPQPEHESGSAPAEADEFTPTPEGDGFSEGEQVAWIPVEYGEVEYPEENNFDLRILIQKRIYEGKIK